MDRLVAQLSNGKHPVEFESRTETYDEIKDRLLAMRFVFIKFTDTIGGTEIGINVDEKLSDLTGGNFENGSGKIYVVGNCELNFYKVRCIANIDLSTKKGTANLELVDI